jgi:hypothetical protein
MQHECTGDPGHALVEVESSILWLLLHPAAPSGLWSLQEIARETGDPQAAVETAVRGLHALGLAHRVDAFVFASRAAAQFQDFALQGTR